MEETEEVIEHSAQACSRMLLHVRDALEVLHGKWKLPILLCLVFGERRFRQIAKEINGITDKMLSKELKDMEANKLITRTVHDSFPPTVIYSVTNHGRSLKPVIDELASWGYKHREEIVGIRQENRILISNGTVSDEKFVDGHTFGNDIPKLSKSKSTF